MHDSTKSELGISRLQNEKKKKVKDRAVAVQTFDK